MKSMTGYGRARQVLNGREITAEIRSVNHRYFDCSVKAPKIYGFLDDAVKKFAGQSIVRGKIDVFISVVSVQAKDVKIMLNESVADNYYALLQELMEKYPFSNDIGVMGFARLPDVMTTEHEEADAEQIKGDVLSVLEEAIAMFDQMRRTEGDKMKDDIQSRGNHIQQILREIEVRAPQRVTEYREKLTAKMQEVLQNAGIDPQRILLEAAVYADKVAVDEETVRLQSHLRQLDTMLNSPAAIGRKLDFLIQEMNREANTIGSKSNDLEMTGKVVDIKAEIEKIREQVQNIE